MQDQRKNGFKIVTLNQSEWAKYFKLPNPDLQAHFLRTSRGTKEVYGTPFYGISDIPTNEGKLQKLKEVVNNWRKILESSSIPEKWPSLMAFENDLSEKIGPLSVMKPLKERLTDIEHYYSLSRMKSIPVSNAAIESTVKEFSKLRGLRVRNERAVLDKMKKSTSSGSPFYRKRNEVVSLTYPCDCDGENSFDENSNPIVKQTLAINTPEYSTWNACAVLGWRGQEGGESVDDVKQRVIWMFPFAVNISELSWYQPFIESCQRFNLVPAWVSMEAVDQRVTDLFDSKSKDDLVVCTDFSKFDQHFGVDMQNAAEAIMHSLAQNNNSANEDWFADVFPIKYRISLAINEGILCTGTHGMASGSGGTNCDETVVHRALQHEAAINAGKLLNPNSMCLGDDGIISYPGITVDDVVATYTQHGQEMNPDKQYASTTDCVYLRRWHHTDYRENGVCVGVYSTYRALNRLAMQERFYDARKWSKEMVELRYLSILENIKYHPLREKFVDYCMKGDKYRLGIDMPGFLDKIVTIAQKATSELPDFLGYTRSMQDPSAKGIADWWIVKYLKSKA